MDQLLLLEPIQLDYVNNSINLSSKGFWAKRNIATDSGYIQLELIVFKNVKNMCGFSIVFTNGNNVTTFPLYRRLTEMIYRDNVYYWDVSRISNFKIKNSRQENDALDILFEEDETDFIVEIYGLKSGEVINNQSLVEFL